MSSPVANALKIGVLHGSVRTGRLGIQLANNVVTSVKALGHTATLFDAKELKLPLLEKPYHHYKGGDDAAPAWLQNLADQFAEQDGFIVVDGEYNHGPTPGILNMLDHFYQGRQFFYKSGAIATYGAAAGGARSAYALRNTLGELGMVVAPRLFSLPAVWSQFTPEGKFATEQPVKNLDTFLKEFSFLTQTLRDQRKNNPTQV